MQLKTNFFVGCGSGVVCPVNQLSTAVCNRCDFDSVSKTCGLIWGFDSLSAQLNGTSCAAQEERIYSGMNRSYLGQLYLVSS